MNGIFLKITVNSILVSLLWLFYNWLLLYPHEHAFYAVNQP